MKKYKRLLTETRRAVNTGVGKYQEDDHYIIEACINGNSNAWTLLIRKYSNLIYASIKNRLRRCNFKVSCQDIEDIRQDILTSLWEKQKLDGIRNRQNISYWLAIVSGNAAIEYIRSKYYKENRAAVSLYDIYSDKPSPSDDIAREENSKRMIKSIELLPVREKLMITMNAYHDKKYYEIAEMMRVPIGTVASCLKRTKERLKEMAENY